MVGNLCLTFSILFYGNITVLAYFLYVINASPRLIPETLQIWNVSGLEDVTYIFVMFVFLLCKSDLRCLVNCQREHNRCKTLPTKISTGAFSFEPTVAGICRCCSALLPVTLKKMSDLATLLVFSDLIWLSELIIYWPSWLCCNDSGVNLCFCVRMFFSTTSSRGYPELLLRFSPGEDVIGYLIPGQALACGSQVWIERSEFFSPWCYSTCENVLRGAHLHPVSGTRCAQLLLQSRWRDIEPGWGAGKGEVGVKNKRMEVRWGVTTLLHSSRAASSTLPSRSDLFLYIQF